MAGVVPCVCPSGYTCDSAGVCVGGNDQAIAIDVKTVNVGGVVTHQRRRADDAAGV